MAIKLTNTYLQTIKPRNITYRIADHVTGLYARILSSGSIAWDFRYTSLISSKRNWLGLGFYKKVPNNKIIMSIAEAREMAEDIYINLQQGIDPKATTDKLLFSTLYEEWRLKREKEDLNAKHISAMHSATSRFILPTLGNLDVTEIKPFMIVEALRKIEAEGKLDTLSKVKSNLGLVFGHFVTEGFIHENTVRQIPGSAFKRPESIPQRHLKLNQIYELHKYFQNEDADELIRLAVEFLARTGLRATEACGALWEEYDEEHKVLVIMKGRMKNRKEHLVPLSSQAVRIIERLKELGTDKSKYIFFDPTSKIKRLNSEAPRNSLTHYNVPTSAHGLRHLFSTTMNELMPDKQFLIELCLAHTPQDKTKTDYDRSQLVVPMREIFQAYSDNIDQCRTKSANDNWMKDNNIILLNRNKKSRSL